MLDNKFTFFMKQCLVASITIEFFTNTFTSLFKKGNIV